MTMHECRTTSISLSGSPGSSVFWDQLSRPRSQGNLTITFVERNLPKIAGRFLSLGTAVLWTEALFAVIVSSSNGTSCGGKKPVLYLETTICESYKSTTSTWNTSHHCWGGMVWERCLLAIWLGGLGSVATSLSEVWGRAPAENSFNVFWVQKKPSEAPF